MPEERKRKVKLFLDRESLDDLLSRLSLEAETRNSDASEEWIIELSFRKAGAPEGMYDLTPVERVVAQHLIEGRSIDEVAAKERLSRSTARTHLRHIFEKVGVDNRASLMAALAARAELCGEISRRKSRPEPGIEPRLSNSLLAHVADTFGSESRGLAWLSRECGALENRVPLEVIEADGSESEVERILDCIDHGMLA